MMKKLFNKYKHLLNDDSFVSWLAGEKNAKWESWKQSEQEHSTFIQFIVGFLKGLKPEQRSLTHTEKALLWNNILDKLPVKTKTKVISLGSWMQTAAAAIILLVSIAAYSLNNVNISSATAEHFQYYLPDSSMVELNAGSEIRYNKLLWRLKRKVKMKGEVFFKVKKGESFVVKAEDMEVAVLGTSFNVYARTDRYQVECFTGKVQVDFLKDTESNILTRGMGVAKTDKDISSFKHKMNTKPLWLVGEFHFNNASYLSVLNELERQFNISIVNKESFANKTYTGFFTNSDVELALEMVLSPISFTYKKEGETIRIIKE